MKTLLLILTLLLPSLVMAEGVTTPAANPTQDITVLSQSGIPFIKASSGTMGNNGAISAMTALPRTFSNGAYIYLPAGAVAAGVPAAATWYWFVASSTTAGTVYNSTYTSGTPRVGTLTAFATTGPGAYTGSIATITAVSIVVPANSMGLNGRVDVRFGFSQNSTAGNKTVYALFGAANMYALTQTTQTSTVAVGWAQNRGLATVQGVGYSYTTSSNSAAGVVQATDGAETTTANVSVNFNLSAAVATDHIVLDQYIIEVRRAY